MERAEYHLSDLNIFFANHPTEFRLYAVLEQRMEKEFPDCAVEIRKTQISFRSRHLFAAMSLPLRRKQGWPLHCLAVTFGLPYRLNSPRIAAVAEPYSGRWTHHVLVEEPAQFDAELVVWLHEAYTFAEAKGRK